mmetsp:Transcript_21304/g.23151  ORF Transcript_21304/g.23151 Transcript_21304/m.23151 type:complete len:88 (+) Transcript_21304:1080-1343(+)
MLTFSNLSVRKVNLTKYAIERFYLILIQIIKYRTETDPVMNLLLTSFMIHIILYFLPLLSCLYHMDSYKHNLILNVFSLSQVYLEEI